MVVIKKAQLPHIENTFPDSLCPFCGSFDNVHVEIYKVDGRFETLHYCAGCQAVYVVQS